MAATTGPRRAGARFLLARGIGSSVAHVHSLGRGGGGVTMPRALLADSAPASAPAMTGRAPPAASSSASAAASRITPAVLFVTVVLAVVLLVSGLLHVLRRLFLKSHHAGAGAGERHLQHLFFPAHDDGAGAGSGSGSGAGGGGGLGQDAIDALPEFAYGELSGGGAAAPASRKGKEKAAGPFDCAVCLSEFADHDRLRLLPLCGHAFHVACIDVWLRSSATCPLCRTKLSARHLVAAAADAPAPASVAPDVGEQRPQQDQAAEAAEAASSSVVLPVRLGRFKNADAESAEAESSNGGATSRVERRRCYSMGSYQYVVADEHLLVSVHLRHGTSAAVAASSGVDGDDRQQHQGKKVFARGDSFSVSKIWQWRGSKRLPGALCADDGLPWAPAKDDRASACTRQRGDT
jgi:hypothetical protein